MNRSGKVFLLALLFLFAGAPVARSQDQPRSAEQGGPRAEERENILVGRIAMVEGDLLRYVPARRDWVVAVTDSPFGLDDALYSGESGKVEYLLPNGTWLRMGPNTQIQMIALKPDATEIDVAVGTTRLMGKSSKAVIKVTTPFGYAVGEPGAAFDVYVGDESIEVIGIRGKVEFVHDEDGSRYEVIPGSMSLLADDHETTTGDGRMDPDWDAWNNARDAHWSQALEVKGESVEHLPEEIREDARTLDENGRWERVYYEGEHRRAWRPTKVEPGWAPYSVGRWTVWNGDYCWVPDEPFGYVTHHYGYWFWNENSWYWAPPIVGAGAGARSWGIGLAWYPGRVGWLYSGSNIGWFPLLPWEPYYAHRVWGPSTYLPRRGGGIDINRYRFANRAVVVNQKALFTTNNLSTVRERKIEGAALARNFRGAPVVSSRVLGKGGHINQRFNFTNRAPKAKPTRAAGSRLAHNRARIGAGGAAVSSGAIRRQLAATRQGKPAARGGVRAPRATSRLGPGTGPAGVGRGKAGVGRGSRTTGSSAVRSGKTGAHGRSGATVGRGKAGTNRGGAGVRHKGAQSRKGNVSGRARTGGHGSDRGRLGKGGGQAPRGGGQVGKRGGNGRKGGGQFRRGGGHLRGAPSVERHGALHAPRAGRLESPPHEYHRQARLT
ncbi:MAG: DUF6600 domain-containing protein [Syntrophobacteraceae bacterium]